MYLKVKEASRLNEGAYNVEADVRRTWMAEGGCEQLGVVLKTCRETMGTDVRLPVCS
jgi:hypothetical protein